MDWAGKQHPVETMVEWLAPAAFGAAGGWSAVSFGLALPVAAVIGGAGFLAALLVIRIFGRQSGLPQLGFELVSFDGADAAADELLLDCPLIDEAGAGELLLDDPLTDIADDARVVRLFARPDPTPGELVARIEDFLGDGQRSAVALPPAANTLPDAGAALQAALANVRASLK